MPFLFEHLGNSLFPEILEFHIAILIVLPVPPPPTPPGEFSQPEFTVDCLADGVLARVDMTDRSFHGVMYVKDHSHDPRCRKAVTPEDARAGSIDFKVMFDTCDLTHFQVRTRTAVGASFQIISVSRLLCSFFSQK